MLVLQQLEFYFSLIVVILVKPCRGCSRFQSLSNHSGGTETSTFDNNFRSRVARSDDNHSQSNMQVSSEDFVTNKTINTDKVYKKQKAAKASSTRKYVVVFDIDECLCSRLDCSYHGMQKVKKTISRFPECPNILWKYTEYGYKNPNNKKYIRKIHVYAHIFLPYLQILFEYLLDQGVRIAFFSAGIKDKNDEVIPELLKFYWGNEKYETFRSQGQFMTFSKDDLIERRVRDPTDENPGNCVKDLSKVIRDGETLKDIILVDDDSSYACPDQKPLIYVQNLYFFEEALNNIYYMYGLFKTYFGNEEYNELPLREGMKKILPNVEQKDERYIGKTRSFDIQMINFGLLEMQKLVPKARLYSDKDPLLFW